MSQKCLFANFGRSKFKRAGFIYCRANNFIAFFFIHRERFSGHH